mmetsp:Transcript_47193/g.47630  ORF Transcript_47193/g.47630 Transcript_47193/m.47630 type:complete len:114 (-) Transcript_47193:262-603(-)
MDLIFERVSLMFVMVYTYHHLIILSCILFTITCAHFYFETPDPLTPKVEDATNGAKLLHQLVAVQNPGVDFAPVPPWLLVWPDQQKASLRKVSFWCVTFFCKGVKTILPGYLG